MRKTILIAFVPFLFAACNNSNTETSAPKNSTKPVRDTLVHVIELLEQKLKTQQTIDYNLGAAMVNAYMDFFNNYPKDAAAADYLFKAAEVSMNVKQSEKAIELFQKVNDVYPNFGKASFALFLQGFIYETQLNDITKAKGKYSQVVEQYPDTKIAEDAKASIANLGKSNEELIKEFEKKNKVK